MSDLAYKLKMAGRGVKLRRVEPTPPREKNERKRTGRREPLKGPVTIEAKFPGTCKLCREPVVVGDRVYWTKTHLSHVECSLLKPGETTEREIEERALAIDRTGDEDPLPVRRESRRPADQELHRRIAEGNRRSTMIPGGGEL